MFLELILFFWKKKAKGCTQYIRHPFSFTFTTRESWLIKVHFEIKIDRVLWKKIKVFVFCVVLWFNLWGCVWGSTMSSMKDWVYQTLTKRHLLPNPTQYSILKGRAVKFPLHFPTLHSHHTFNLDPKSKGNDHSHFTLPKFKKKKTTITKV